MSCTPWTNASDATWFAALVKTALINLVSLSWYTALCCSLLFISNHSPTNELVKKHRSIGHASSIRQQPASSLAEESYGSGHAADAAAVVPVATEPPHGVPALRELTDDTMPASKHAKDALLLPADARYGLPNLALLSDLPPVAGCSLRCLQSASSFIYALLLPRYHHYAWR